MTRVSVSDLRQHLPAYHKRVQEGEELQVTSRGRVIARIEPERDPAEEARAWLEGLRGRVVLGDVMAPFTDVAWSVDADRSFHTVIRRIVSRQMRHCAGFLS